jgi:hypothetical protein
MTGGGPFAARSIPEAGSGSGLIMSAFAATALQTSTERPVSVGTLLDGVSAVITVQRVVRRPSWV